MVLHYLHPYKNSAVKKKSSFVALFYGENILDKFDFSLWYYHKSEDLNKTPAAKILPQAGFFPKFPLDKPGEKW